MQGPARPGSVRYAAELADTVAFDGLFLHSGASVCFGLIIIRVI
jgi:hypothetical protein